MKLNKRQLNSIATKISKELKLKNDLEKEEFKNNYAYVEKEIEIIELFEHIEEFKKKLYSLQNKLQDKLKSYYNNNNDININNNCYITSAETFKNKIISTYFKGKQINYEDILNDIILYTIDSETLEDILTKMSEKYN